MKVDMDSVLEACMRDDYTGFCMECGAEHGGIEPDGQRYQCDECGKFSVYGAEELLLMG